MDNNSAINGPVNVVGGWSLGGNVSMAGSPIKDHAPPIADPYAGLTVGSVPACTGQSGSGNNNAQINLSPGHFCSGWDFGNNVRLNLAPGTYYIDSMLSAGNNANITGTGVTLVVNGNYGVDLDNNTSVSLTAETSGAFARRVIVGLSTASMVTQTFANNTSIQIIGAIYFPHQIINMENNGATAPGGCTQVIGPKISIANNVNFGNNCDGTGVEPLGTTPTQPVE